MLFQPRKTFVHLHQYTNKYVFDETREISDPA